MTGLNSGRLLRYRGDCRRYQNRAVQNLYLNLKERTEPGPSKADSGARTVNVSLISPDKPGERLMLSPYFAVYERVTCFSGAYGSGPGCFIASHGASRGWAQYGRTQYGWRAQYGWTRRHGASCFWRTQRNGASNFWRSRRHAASYF